jgi:hypothetical protein
MIPVKPSNNQQNCNPISSNCVTWQGPDIACINLQKGDTVSDVTYKLAVELCDLLDQTNLNSFDLSCFDPVCPKPENFHDLVQFIIVQELHRQRSLLQLSLSQYHLHKQREIVLIVS